MYEIQCKLSTKVWLSATLMAAPAPRDCTADFYVDEEGYEVASGLPPGAGVRIGALQSAYCCPW